MLEARERVVQHIKDMSLPDDPSQILDGLYSSELGSFPIQESLHWDYKVSFPKNSSDDYFGSIVRLVCAFYNTYGGIIIFGVHDKDRTAGHGQVPVNIENFNHILSKKLNVPVECIHRKYALPGVTGRDNAVDVILVPKRPATVVPARMIVAISKYLPHILWGRFGHEVRKIEATELPIFYMGRDDYGIEATRAHASFSIHRSIPPSPSAAHEFIGRTQLMDELWTWLVNGKSPRFFLHGPGGSGKSTLAHEFARSVAESGKYIPTSSKKPLDFIVYLSAKETELNTFDGKIQGFSARDFSTAEEQFAKILIHSGFVKESELPDLKMDLLSEKLKELLETFHGLIVLDDIDALMRKGKDPGMEALFEIVLRADPGAKVLYTLRSVPSMARASAVAVPGLEFESEYLPFVDSYCRQLKLAPPDSAFIVNELATATGQLPLLVETLIAMRRRTSTYKQALVLYETHKGEQAREYMFSREYECLSSRARLLLCALRQFDHPIGTDLLKSVLQCSAGQVSDAIGEVLEIFLQTQDPTGASTVFEVTPTAWQFIDDRSKNLPLAQQVIARAHWSKTQYLPEIPQINAIRLELQSFVEREDFEGALTNLEQKNIAEIVRQHPAFKAQVGYLYSQCSPPNVVDARECFQFAFDNGYRDVLMMRTWFYLEYQGASNTQAALRVCNLVLDSAEFKILAKSEFHSKRGQTFRRQAKEAGRYDVERALMDFQQSVEAYLDSVNLQRANGLSTAKAIQWLQMSFSEYIGLCIQMRDFSIISNFIREQVAKRRTLDGIEDQFILFFANITRIYRGADTSKLEQLLRRVISSLSAKSTQLFSDRPVSDRFHASVVAALAEIQL